MYLVAEVVERRMTGWATRGGDGGTMASGMMRRMVRRRVLPSANPVAATGDDGGLAASDAPPLRPQGYEATGFAALRPR